MSGRNYCWVTVHECLVVPVKIAGVMHHVDITDCAYAVCFVGKCKNK